MVYVHLLHEELSLKLTGGIGGNTSGEDRLHCDHKSKHPSFVLLRQANEVKKTTASTVDCNTRVVRTENDMS